jgi:flagellin-like protein
MTAMTGDEGVSVIVGTLLLILITVTAAAGLAIMISQMQKDAMNRQAHISAVQNEQILITGVTFESVPAVWDQTFWPPNGTLNQSYSAVTFSLTNLNTEDSSVIGMSVNGIYAHNFTVVSSSSQPEYIPYNFSSQDPSSSLAVPASASEKIRINFTTDFFSLPPHIGPNDQVTIQVMTSLYNTFAKSFQPPNPVIQSNTVTQNLGSIQRDALVLDGTQSFAANNNTIVDWNWSVQDASGTITDGAPDQQGNCTDTQNLTTPNYLKGKIAHFQPNLPGPFCVYLTVQDSSGMKKSSDYVVIPSNDQFVPPANFWVQFNPNPPSNFINVTIKDINGKPVPNAVVNYIIDTNQFGNLSLDNYEGITDGNGMNSSNVTSGIGTVKVISGNFAPIEIGVRGSS